MDIKAEKLGLIEWITQLSDISIINQLKNIQLQSSMDTPYSLSSSESESIERGLLDHEEGRVHTHEEARKIYEKYL